MTYTSYFRKSLQFLAKIEEEGLFVLDKKSLYDPEEIEMMLDVLFRLNFIIEDGEGYVISNKGKNVLNYFKDELVQEKNTFQKPVIK